MPEQERFEHLLRGRMVPCATVLGRNLRSAHGERIAGCDLHFTEGYELVALTVVYYGTAREQRARAKRFPPFRGGAAWCHFRRAEQRERRRLAARRVGRVVTLPDETGVVTSLLLDKAGLPFAAWRSGRLWVLESPVTGNAHGFDYTPFYGRVPWQQQEEALWATR